MRINSKDVVIYSVKVYKNATFVTAFNTEKNKYAHFEISSRYNECDKIIRLFMSKLYFFVGYDNKHYDNIFINFLLKKRDHITKLGCSYLNKVFYEQFIMEHLRKHDWDDYLLELKYAQNFDYIDLAMMLSSKYSRHSIYEECFKSNIPCYIENKEDEYLSYDEFENEFKKMDVRCQIIYNIFMKNYDKIDLRIGMFSKYNIDVLDNNDSSVLNTILLDKYQSENKVKYNDLTPTSEEIYSSPITNIACNDIKFESEEFNEFFDQLKHMLYSSMDNKNLRRFVTFKNSDILFATNGIECESNVNIFKSDGSGKIYILKINSLDASVCLRYGIYPKKLTEKHNNFALFKNSFDNFLTCEIQSPLGSSRKKLFEEGLDNIVYKYNVKKSWLYDVSAYAKVKINSSLIMMMLIEKLLLNNASIILIENNTIIFKSQTDLENVIKKWNLNYGLSYDYIECKKFFKYSVYDYFAMCQDNKILSNGIFENKEVNSQFPSVVIKAVKNHLLYNTSVSDTIRNSGNIFDFVFFNKVNTPKNFMYKGVSLGNEVMFYITDVALPNLYVQENLSKNPYHVRMDCLIKGVSVQPFEKYMIEKSYVKFNVDYGFYIAKAMSMISEIKTVQTIIQEENINDDEKASDNTENIED